MAQGLKHLTDDPVVVSSIKSVPTPHYKGALGSTVICTLVLCMYAREKSFCKTLFQVGMDLKKVQKKQGMK